MKLVKKATAKQLLKEGAVLRRNPSSSGGSVWTVLVGRRYIGRILDSTAERLKADLALTSERASVSATDWSLIH